MITAKAMPTLAPVESPFLPFELEELTAVGLRDAEADVEDEEVLLDVRDDELELLLLLL